MPYSSTSVAYLTPPLSPRSRMPLRDDLWPVAGLPTKPRPVPAAIGGNTLQYFNVTGFCYDVQQPDPTQLSAQPQLANVSAFVDFFPGNQNGPFPAGFSLIIPNMNHGDGTVGDTIVPLAPITARFLGGSLRTIVGGDPVGVLLLSNTSLLGLPLLLYHVRFRNVTYGGATTQITPGQLIQPASQVLTNFAFQASTDNTPVNLTGVNTVRLPYLGPQ